MDHTDYYPNLTAVQDAFLALMQKVPDDGAIVADVGHPNIVSLIAQIRESRNIKIIDYKKAFRDEAHFQLLLPGDFNQENACAAAAAARFLLPEASMNNIRASLSGFHGTWRRFEYKGKTKKGADVYDDYAHHPTAVKATLAELRKKATGRLYVAFHPHLYSRTKDLLPEFATAFAGADRVIIAPIYAARETDDGTVSNATLAEEIAKHGVDAKPGTFEEIQRFFETEPKEGDVVMTMGAGDIYKVADELVGRS